MVKMNNNTKLLENGFLSSMQFTNVPVVNLCTLNANATSQNILFYNRCISEGFHSSLHFLGHNSILKFKKNRQQKIKSQILIFFFFLMQMSFFLFLLEERNVQLKMMISPILLTLCNQGHFVQDWGSAVLCSTQVQTNGNRFKRQRAE